MKLFGNHRSYLVARIINSKLDERLPLLLLFGLNLLLLYPTFFPYYQQINPYDEAGYINNGRMLTEGVLTPYYLSPLVSVLYAAIYLVVKNLTFWFLHAAGIGRFILFCLLWLSNYLIARQLRNLFNPLISMGLFLISPVVIISLLNNSSDALFSAMSGFALWQLLAFHENKRRKHLFLASFFLGLANLSRNDGLVLFVIFVVLNLAIAFLGDKNLASLGMVLLGSILPFVIIVGGYILFQGIVTGDFSPGTELRTYSAIEQGQGIAYSTLFTKGDPLVKAQLTTAPPHDEVTDKIIESVRTIQQGEVEFRQLFGTGIENNYSVLRAIERNPEAYFSRVAHIIRTAPQQAIAAYGLKVGVLFLLLSLVGIIELIKRKNWILLTNCLFWPAYLIIYAGIFFRTGYFLLPYFIVFLLTAIGLYSFIQNIKQNKYLYSSLSLLSLVAVFSIITNNPDAFTGALAIILGILFIRTVVGKISASPMAKQVALLLVFIIGLLLAEPYPTPDIRRLGFTDEEKVALFLSKNFDSQVAVAAYAPGLGIMAKKSHYVSLYGLSTSLPPGSEEAFLNSLSADCKAIILDKYLMFNESLLYNLIDKDIGKRFKVAFSTEDTAIRIVTPVGRCQN